MADEPALMIFAAGFGSRMGKLVDNKPKPLVEVGGLPMLEYALNQVKGVNLSRVAVNTHYKHEALSTYLRDRSVVVLSELPTILETGGGLKAALPLLGPAPLMTLNSDVIWLGSNPLSLLKAAWNPTKMDALLLCVALKRTTGRTGSGDFAFNHDGTLQREGAFVYAGAQYIKTDSLADLRGKAFSINKLWDIFLERKRLYGILYDGDWCDVGTSLGIAEAEKKLSEVSRKKKNL